MSYDEARKFSDRKLPEVQRIIAPFLFQAAPFVEDTQHATDLMILTAKDKRIAVRIRRNGYAMRYPNQFTIRSFANGCKTEIHKIRDGFGDYFFYGHSSDDNTSAIGKWMFLDLDVFRDEERSIKPHDVVNRDGTRGYAYDVTRFSRKILVASNYSIFPEFNNRAAPLFGLHSWIDHKTCNNVEYLFYREGS